jgi:hypothetical protein
LRLEVALGVGHEAEIGAPASGAARRRVHIGIDRRTPALEDLRLLDDGGGFASPCAVSGAALAGDMLRPSAIAAVPARRSAVFLELCAMRVSV